MYSVKINSIEKRVYRADRCDFVQAVSDDTVKIEVICKSDIKTAVLKPLSMGKVPAVSDNTVTFEAKSGDKLCLVINGDKKRPLFVSVSPRIERPEDNGNTLYFEGEKDYNTGIIELSDNQTVYIGEGTVINGGLRAENKKNIRIIGHGIIKNLTKSCVTEFKYCDGIYIEGITAVGYGAWHNNWRHCTNIDVNDYKIYGGEIYSDGIDLVACSDAHLKNIMICNNDDGICVKLSGGKAENIVSEDCVIWSGERGNSTEIGYELEGDYVRNVVFKNIDVINRGTRESKFRRSAISIHNAGSAKVYDVVYDNIRIEETEENLFHIERIEECPWGECRGSIENIRLENISYLDTKKAPINIINNAKVKGKLDISFKNLVCGGKRIETVEELKENGLVVSGEALISFHK